MEVGQFKCLLPNMVIFFKCRFGSSNMHAFIWCIINYNPMFIIQVICSLLNYFLYKWYKISSQTCHFLKMPFCGLKLWLYCKLIVLCNFGLFLYLFTSYMCIKPHLNWLPNKEKNFLYRKRSYYSRFSEADIWLLRWLSVPLVGQ